MSAARILTCPVSTSLETWPFAQLLTLRFQEGTIGVLGRRVLKKRRGGYFEESGRSEKLRRVCREYLRAEYSGSLDQMVDVL